MATSLDNYQPSLVLTEFVSTEGIYPSRDLYHDGMTLGMLRTFAGNFNPAGTPSAGGALLPIAQNAALFSILGTSYGGNGITTFALPDLGGRAAIGVGFGPGLTPRAVGEITGSDSIDLTRAELPFSLGGFSAPVSNIQPSLGMTYVIRTEGTPRGGSEVGHIGEVIRFAGNFAPGGFMAADGRLLAISDYAALYSVIGTKYGGDGITTFALPDLRGRAVIGASDSAPIGTKSGTETVTLTQGGLSPDLGGIGNSPSNAAPSLALTYLIALSGIFPPRDGGGYVPEWASIVGEVIAFAGDTAPPGWAKAEGQLLSIVQNTALFALIGTTYGGDGITTFALPDLRGRVVFGYAGANALYGGDDADILRGLDGDDTLTGNGGDDMLYGGTGADLMIGGRGNDTYYVDNAGDQVIEAAGEGSMDRLFSSVSYILHADQHIERIATMSSAGTRAINLVGSNSDQTMVGNAGANIMRGLDGADLLIGAAGNDRLLGGSGDDILQGGRDNDRLYGGRGNDVLNGGSGRDVFVFDTTLDAATNVDIIEDYNVADDSIWLDGTVFRGLALGALAHSAFTTGTAATAAAHRIIYDDITGGLFFDRDGDGAGAAIQFASLASGLAMGAGEFTVI